MLEPERLDELLTRLRLTAIRDQLDSLLDEASRAQMTLREALLFLAEREVARRDTRRIQMGMKLAPLPVHTHARRLRLRRTALDRSGADPGSVHRALDRPRSGLVAARPAGRG